MYNDLFSRGVSWRSWTACVTQIPLGHLGDALCDGAVHAPGHRHRPAPGRAAGGGRKGRRPAPAQGRAACAERHHQPAALRPVSDFDDHGVPSVPAHHRHRRGHHGHHRSAGGGGVPVRRPAGGGQPAGGRPQHHRGGPEHGRHPRADHLQGDDPRERPQPAAERHHRPDDRFWATPP